MNARRIVNEAANHLVIILRRHRAATPRVTRDRADLRCLGPWKPRRLSNPRAFRVGAVREQQLHQRAVAGARRGMQRSALRRGWLVPARVDSRVQQQARDIVMARFNGRGQRTSSTRSCFSNARGFGVEDPPDFLGVAKRGGNSQIAGRTARENNRCDARIAASPPSAPDCEVDRLEDRTKSRR